MGLSGLLNTSRNRPVLFGDEPDWDEDDRHALSFLIAIVLTAGLCYIGYKLYQDGILQF
jgi:hypothetical protein